MFLVACLIGQKRVRDMLFELLPISGSRKCLLWLITHKPEVELNNMFEFAVSSMFGCCLYF